MMPALLRLLREVRRRRAWFNFMTQPARQPDGDSDID
jgi:hypothetical protein